MSDYKIGFKRALTAFIASLPLLLISCAMPTDSGTPVSSGEVVNVKGCCSLSAPKGEGWTVEINDRKGEITFYKKHEERKSTFIAIGSGYVELSSGSKTEDQAAAYIFATEKKIMRERGSKRNYLLKGIEHYKKTIGIKKLHVMKYIISDHSKTPVEMGYMMHLYFPDYTREPNTYYVFLVGEVIAVENIHYPMDATFIEEVIDSFKIN